MAQADDTADEKANWHWRNSMRPVRFFGLDARAAIPFLITLFYLRIVTVVLTIVFTTVFIMLEKRGLTFPASLRKFRCWLLGQRRPAWRSFRRRKLVDYG